MTVSVSFAAAFAGAKYTYISGSGGTNSSAMQQMGSWTINATNYPDLTISTMNHTPSSFTQGQTGTYNITVANIGSAAASVAVQVTDTLLTGLTASSMNGSGWSCTQPGGPCTRSDVLAAGASYPAIALTVSVASNAPASLDTKATFSGGGETNTSNDTATDTTAINPSGGARGDLAQGKTATQSSTLSGYSSAVAASAVDGNTDGYFFDVPGSVTSTNSELNAWWQVDLGSSVAVSSVVVWNRMDACCSSWLNDYWIFVSNTPFLSTDTPSTLQNRALTWSSHQTTVPNPSTTVSAGSAPGRYVRVQLTGTNYLDLAEVQVYGSTAPDMTITKIHTGNFTQGQIGATYTITATNSGNAPTSAPVTVVDSSLPAGLTASGMSGSGWSCNVSTVTCTRSDVLAAAGSNYPAITLTVNVAGNAPIGTATNTATVSGGGESNTGNDFANDATTIQGVGYTLATMATPPNNSRLGGSTVTFTWNAGSGTTGYILYVGSCPGGNDYSGGPGTNLFQTVPGLPTDGRIVYVRLFTFVTSLQSYLYNDYTYAAFNSIGTPNLTIAKIHLGDFTQGQVGDTYTITVTNNGTATTTSGTVATVTDTLPAGGWLTATSINGGVAWSCTQPAGPCIRSDALAVGASYAPITLTVNVAANAPTSVANQASVSSTGQSAPSTSNDVTTINGACGAPATMTTPPNGSTLSGSSVTFNWCGATGATQYYLYVGTTVGTNNLFGQSVWPGTSWTVTGLPTDGRTLYVRLWTLVGTWQFIDYTYVSGGTLLVTVTVTSSPGGRSLTVDGAGCTAPCSFQWTSGTAHTIAATAAPQAGGAGTQYVFANWSDSGAASHSVAPTAATTTYTANFTTQYLLTTVVSPAVAPAAGTIVAIPAGPWFNSGASVQLTATANSGYQFTNFSGSLSGTTTPQNLTISAPASVTANFGIVTGGTDLAQGRTATQSSTLPGYPTAVAGSAVDGNTDGNFNDGSVTATNADLNAWWQVDLGSSATVSSVVVWNRTDCCADRLSDYWVFVSNTPFLSTDTPSTLQSRAGMFSSHQTAALNPSTNIAAGGAQGQYVRVQLTGTNNLSLAEVQVFGSIGQQTVAAPTFNPLPGTYSSTQSVALSTTTPGASIRYTTDGSTPSSTAGIPYTGAISVGSTTTIKAIAYEVGWADSTISPGTYTISSGGTSWYNTAWGNRKKVAILHGQVSGTSNLTSFPVLVSILSDANLQAGAKADGSDILFTDSGGVTKLNHEIEQYDSATGKLIAWVGVPSLSPTADTVLYLYYTTPRPPVNRTRLASGTAITWASGIFPTGQL